jgi:hypothetical protein
LIAAVAGRYASGVMRLLAAASLLASSLLLPACATYQEDLQRGQRAFEESEHEHALAIFRALEPDLGRLSPSERTHYEYLRGMTDYRIGYKAEARHWLSLASAMEQQTPGSLPPDWAKRMTESLKDLNEEVYTGGIESLTNASSPAQKPSKVSDEDDSTPPGSGDSPAKTDKSAPKPDGAGNTPPP